MPRFAIAPVDVPVSGIRRIHEVALGLEDVISLAVGEPDVPVAQHVLRAAEAAWAADQTNYTANAGIPPLRRAIAEKLKRVNGYAAAPHQVWVTVGATQALYFALTLVLDPGDEVLIPDPGYTTFRMGAQALRATPVPYPLAAERGFLPDAAALDALVTSRTRAIIVNSPSNPLGTVFDAATIRSLVAFAERHDLWLISDEVYEAFTDGVPHVSPAVFDRDGRVLGVYSLSKTFALTGARVGYLVLPPGIDDTVLGAVQEAMVSCVNTPAQLAAVAAITGPGDATARAARHYAANAQAARSALAARGIRSLEPRGAFYLWVDVAHAAHGDVAAWALDFLREQRVAIAPGTAFGARGEGWIRVCLAADRELLLEGLARIPAP